jgi:HK97 family phage prohead protease
MGRRLAAVLNEGIEAMVDDDTSRSEIVEQMGDAAGIDAGTVNQILNASINCPPPRRVRAFARVLDLSVSRLFEAGNADGCNYDEAEGNSQPEFERRFVTHEVRMVEVEGQRHLVGYGAVFDQRSENLGGFIEEIAPGAFTRTLAEADVRGLMNHDSNLILGRTGAGTMALREDDIGLRYDISLPETSYASDLIVSLERGDINQSSFGFRLRKDLWTLQEDEPQIRRLLDVDLFDTGPVTFPAYPQTSAEARTMADIMRNGCRCQGTPTAGHDRGAVGRLAYRKRLLDLLERL